LLVAARAGRFTLDLHDPADGIATVHEIGFGPVTAMAARRTVTPTGYGTELAKGKETREIGGRSYVS
jgi:hypothetical protein